MNKHPYFHVPIRDDIGQNIHEPKCEHVWAYNDGGYGNHSSFYSYSSSYYCKKCKDQCGQSSPGILSVSFITSWYAEHTPWSRRIA